ncbi:hypothetical protein L4D08_13585 [Photobacterium chitinilyticum]|uniref:hypothetical protein n=1 Tax=Photobacterium chitinilyticum TaxID=2485123 RepID=UPI003D0B6436
MAQPNCFIVNHYDYHLKHVKVRLKSAGDPGVFGVANRNSLDLVMKGRDTPECLIRYNDNVVQQVNFTGGGSYNSINMPNTSSSFNENNSILYTDSSGKESILVDFNTGDCHTVTDSDGIDGGPAAKIEAKLSVDSLNPYAGKQLLITISPM